MPERYFRDELTSGGRPEPPEERPTPLAARRLLAEAPAPDPNPGGRHPHPDPWCRACVAHGITLAYLEG